MATLHVLDEPFIDAQFKYIYVTRNWTFDNAEITNSGMEYKKDIPTQDGDIWYNIPHVWGKTLNAGESVTLSNPLTIKFKDGLQSLDDGQFYDITFQFTSIYIKNVSGVRAYVNGVRFNQWGGFMVEAFAADPSSYGSVGDGYFKYTYKVIRHGGPDGGIPVSAADVDQPVEFWTPQSDAGIQNIYVFTNSWLKWTGKSIDTSRAGTTQSVSFPCKFENDRDHHGSSSELWETAVIAIQTNTSGTYTYEAQGCGAGLSGADVPTYTITYNTLGGSYIQPTLKAIRKSTKISSKSPTKNSSDNTHFLGWSKTEGGDKVYSPGDTYSIDEDITLYARWEYRVRYVSSSDNVLITPSTTINSNYDEWKNHGTDIGISQYATKYQDSDLVVAVSTSSGWSTSSSATIAQYITGSNYTDNAPITLYPVWSPYRVTVKFYVDYTKSTLISSTTVNAGQTTSAPANPTQVGKTFNGWSTKAYLQPIYGNLDVYGLWEQGYIWYMTRNAGWVMYHPEED